MSRHRNVRSMNYEDEYYDEDDVYGHSVEDNYCISPGTAAQFTFNRDHNVALSNFMDEQGGIPEEDEEGADTDEGTPRQAHRSSLDYTRPQLNDIDEAKLNSVLEEVRNVLGDTVPEHVMVDTILRHNFSVERSLNEMLEAPKPQREPRKDRRNRAQECDLENDALYSVSPNPNLVFSCNPMAASGRMKFGDKMSPNLISEKETSLLGASLKAVQKPCTNASGRKIEKPADSLNKNESTINLSNERTHTTLSNLAKSNQSGNSLSDLVKSNQSGGTKLSDLAKLNQSGGVKLSDLAKPNESERLTLSDLSKSNQSGGIKLSDLAKVDQNKNNKMTVTSKDQNMDINGLSVALSDLAKAHLSQSPRNLGTNSNVEMPSQSLLAKPSLGSSPESSFVKPPLGSSPQTSLGKQHLGSSPQTSLGKQPLGSSPQTSLDKQPLGSSPMSAAANHSPGSLQLSAPSSCTSSPLSMLAKQDAQTKQTQSAPVKPGLSLAQLAAAHGVKKSQPGSPSTAKDKQEKMDLGIGANHPLITKDISKVKTDANQIMSSLSSLLADKTSKHTVQHSAISIPKSTLVKTDHSSLDMHSKSPTLMDLVKKPVQLTQKKTLEELPTKQKKEQKKCELSGKSDVSLQPDLNNTDENSENVDPQSSSENLIFIEDLPIEDMKHLMNRASTLGHSICLTSSGTSLKSHKKRYKWKGFQYKHQMKGMVLQPCKEMNKIIPYNFKDPSPDDVVKSKQKQAFTR